MQKIRTFIAIKIPSQLEAAFEELIQSMQHIPNKVKWVKPASIHLTLKFLGEITQKDVQRVLDRTERAVANISSFTLKTSQRGAFPSLKRPRVFWVGLTERNGEQLIGLQKNIESELETEGFPKEKREFKPHLTVGRVKSPKNIEEVSKQFMAYQFPEIEFAVNEVVVMKSELTRQGAIYTMQKSFPLKN